MRPAQTARMIPVLMAVCFLTLPVPAQYSGGTGEPNDPYQIATAAHLIALGETPDDYDKHFILTADIDLDPNVPGRKVFDRAVIAPDTDTDDVITWFEGTAFCGVFDGNGHTISHLTITGDSWLGLFGCLESGGPAVKVSDLGLVDIQITGSGGAIGGLVGDNHSDVIQCYSSGTVSGRACVGGLAGHNSYGSIGDCHSSAVVSGSAGIGGLVGVNQVNGHVIQCHSAGRVVGESAVGGLVGENRGDVASCHSIGPVSGAENVGGLAGTNQLVFVLAFGVVTDCYSTSAVNGNSNVGGLVGLNHCAIDNCYSTGWVSGTGAGVGGLVGFGSGNWVTGCFWDILASEQTNSAAGTGKTRAEMQTASTFLEAGWDFVGETENGTDDIWKMWDGYDYPRLACEPGPNTPLVFVDINDPGFYGQMSRYEVTNAQYCDFLNAALASGDITVNGADIEGAGGSNSGADYLGQRYYRCDGSGYTGYGATNGGAALIHYSEGAFSVDEGFGNHPVTYVSWYGAMAFCSYYGYSLPTEDQWQAVADYDGTYIYGCGETIDPGIANYRDSAHPDGTLPVGSFGRYGYGMSDMAGNVWEWTSSGSDSSRIFRGGSLGSIDSDCDVSIRGDGIPYANYYDIGFRVCR